MMKTQPKFQPPQQINPADLALSPELLKYQPSMPISAEDRQRLHDDIKTEGAVRDPIKAYYDEKMNLLILGGKNRWEIAQELGLKSVPVVICNLNSEERSTLVRKDNTSRRHFTRDQLQAVLELELKSNPHRSDRSIAKDHHVDPKTVGSIRKKLEDNGHIQPSEKRQGKDGKAYKAPVKKSQPDMSKYVRFTKESIELSTVGAEASHPVSTPNPEPRTINPASYLPRDPDDEGTMLLALKTYAQGLSPKDCSAFRRIVVGFAEKNLITAGRLKK